MSSINQTQTCGDCNGTGRAKTAGVDHNCRACLGSGQVQTIETSPIVLPAPEEPAHRIAAPQAKIVSKPLNIKE